MLETQQEWACIENWVLYFKDPEYQRFAISMSADNLGIYQWQNEDRTSSFPDWPLPWATGHPSDKTCVGMVIGSGVDHEGEFVDVDCHEDAMYGICELQPF